MKMQVSPFASLLEHFWRTRRTDNSTLSQRIFWWTRHVNLLTSLPFDMPVCASVPFCSLACHFARFLCYYELNTLPCSSEHAALLSACIQSKSKMLIRHAKWHTARVPACHFTHCLLFSMSFWHARAFTFWPKFPWWVTNSVHYIQCKVAESWQGCHSQVKGRKKRFFC